MEHLTVLSNRLPVRLEREDRGPAVLRPSDGGLVTALEPLLRRRGGAWVGWPGMAGRLTDAARADLEVHGREGGYRMMPVPLSRDEIDVHYHGACNRVLWPLLHGFLERVHHDPAHARGYEDVNRRFAAAAAAVATDIVWVHDYHLMGVGESLRRSLPGARLGFFLHTPFPPGAIMAQLPWGVDLLPSLAAYDLLGFQSEEDREAFHDWVGGLGRRPAVRGRRLDGRTLDAAAFRGRTGVFPAAPDFEAFHDEARRPAVVARARAIREEVDGRRILLAVDRLDYTKGIPQRLRAYARLLETEPGLRGRVVLDQLVVPSRTAIADYASLRSEIEGLVGRINGAFGRGTWTPVRYVYGTRDRRELLAWYAAADVAVVTPLRDGMNLVAKEYCAANPGTGALVLSRFAGAAAELGHGAFLVNPWDPDGFAAQLRDALALDRGARSSRMESIRRGLQDWDAHVWAETFLQALAGARRVPSAGTVRPRLRPAPHWPLASRRPVVQPATVVAPSVEVPTA